MFFNIVVSKVGAGAQQSGSHVSPYPGDRGANYVRAEDLPARTDYYDRVTDIHNIKPGDVVVVDYDKKSGIGGAYAEVVRRVSVNAKGEIELLTTRAREGDSSRTLDRSRLLTNTTFDPDSGTWHREQWDRSKNAGSISIHILRPREQAPAAQHGDAGATVNGGQASGAGATRNGDGGAPAKGATPLRTYNPTELGRFSIGGSGAASSPQERSGVPKPGPIPAPDGKHSGPEATPHPAPTPERSHSVTAQAGRSSNGAGPAGGRTTAETAQVADHGSTQGRPSAHPPGQARAGRGGTAPVDRPSDDNAAPPSATSPRGVPAPAKQGEVTARNLPQKDASPAPAAPVKTPIAVPPTQPIVRDTATFEESKKQFNDSFTETRRTIEATEGILKSSQVTIGRLEREIAGTGWFDKLYSGTAGDQVRLEGERDFQFQLELRQKRAQTQLIRATALGDEANALESDNKLEEAQLKRVEATELLEKVPLRNEVKRLLELREKQQGLGQDVDKSVAEDREWLAEKSVQAGNGMMAVGVAVLPAARAVQVAGAALAAAAATETGVTAMAALSAAGAGVVQGAGVGAGLSLTKNTALAATESGSELPGSDSATSKFIQRSIDDAKTVGKSVGVATGMAVATPVALPLLGATIASAPLVPGALAGGASAVVSGAINGASGKDLAIETASGAIAGAFGQSTREMRTAARTAIDSSVNLGLSTGTMYAEGRLTWDAFTQNVQSNAVSALVGVSVAKTGPVKIARGAPAAAEPEAGAPGQRFVVGEDDIPDMPANVQLGNEVQDGQPAPARVIVGEDDIPELPENWVPREPVDPSVATNPTPRFERRVQTPSEALSPEVGPVRSEPRPEAPVPANGDAPRAARPFSPLTPAGEMPRRPRPGNAGSNGASTPPTVPPADRAATTPSPSRPGTDRPNPAPSSRPRAQFMPAQNADGVEFERDGARWRVQAPLDTLMVGNGERAKSTLRFRGSDNALEIFEPRGTALDKPAEQRQPRHLRDALGAAVSKGGLKGVREVHVVDSIGEMLDDSGNPIGKIQILPPDEEGRLFVARSALSTKEEAETLFGRYVDQEARVSADQLFQQEQLRDRTDGGVQRQQRAGNYVSPDAAAPHGRDRESNRPIIGRDARITDGVYFSKSSLRPGIVVAPDDDPALRSAALEFDQRVSTAAPSNLLEAAQQIQGFVREKMPYWRPEEHMGIEVDRQVVRSRIGASAVPSADQKVTLGEFLSLDNGNGTGGGECAHQGLLAGVLAERLQTQGVIAPDVRISLERNQVVGIGAHAWLRLESPDGLVAIVDPAQNYVGPLTVSNGGVYRRATDVPATLLPII